MKPILARGTTLIELMLTLTLSLLLLGLLAVIYLATEQQNELQSDLNALQANGRLALQSLSVEVQAAGFIGCPRLTSEFPLNNTTVYSLQAQAILELDQDSKGSTMITVRHRSLKSQVLQVPMTKASILQLTAEFQVNPGDILLISDCQHADLFQVAGVLRRKDWQRLTTLNPLRYQYSENAEVGLWESNTYFVEKTKRRDKAGQIISALYVKDLSGHKTELVEGIQKMKVETFRAGQGVKRLGVSIELEVQQRNLSKTEYGFIALRN